MSSVTFAEATCSYPGHDKTAVDRLNLNVEPGEFLALVGPSGCGKSTSLRMLAGLEQVTAGRILIGEDDITNVEPRDRDIAMVFQNYALYPHMTVGENMAFALKVARVDKHSIQERVNEAARMLELLPYLDRKPKDLSGGQRQRVAMGRAIVRQPRVFLMDEPLSNLDAKLQVQTRAQIAELQRRLGATTVYVTHDQVEAMTMGDRVAVLHDGVLQQCATPREMYARPANLFVAGFLGWPTASTSSSCRWSTAVCNSAPPPFPCHAPNWVPRRRRRSLSVCDRKILPSRTTGSNSTSPSSKSWDPMHMPTDMLTSPATASTNSRPSWPESIGVGHRATVIGSNYRSSRNTRCMCSTRTAAPVSRVPRPLVSAREVKVGWVMFCSSARTCRGEC